MAIKTVFSCLPHLTFLLDRFTSARDVEIIIKRILLIFPDTLFSWPACSPGIGYIVSALEGIGYAAKFIDCRMTPGYK